MISQSIFSSDWGISQKFTIFRFIVMHFIFVIAMNYLHTLIAVIFLPFQIRYLLRMPLRLEVFDERIEILFFTHKKIYRFEEVESYFLHYGGSFGPPDLRIKLKDDRILGFGYTSGPNFLAFVNHKDVRDKFVENEYSFDYLVREGETFRFYKQRPAPTKKTI